MTTIELIVCGSSNGHMSTFGEWEWEVLSHTYDQVDYLAIHSYIGRGKSEDSFSDYLASRDQMSNFILKSIALSDAVGARKKSDKHLMIAFDEWNVVRPGAGKREEEDEWTVGRRLAICSSSSIAQNPKTSNPVSPDIGCVSSEPTPCDLNIPCTRRLMDP